VIPYGRRGVTDLKLIFSEFKSDYSHYVFPYAIWAIPEKGDTPAQIFNQGFLPSTHNLDRYYMSRQIRVRLDAFKQSSENRRIMRKCPSISYELLTREEFDFTAEKRDFCRHYADIKFGNDVMSEKRLDSLIGSRIISHILVYRDTESGRDVGYVTLFLEPTKLAYFYYSFYDLNYYERNLGMYMMTTAVDFFKNQDYDFLYLGTCYRKNALYKTQFAGFEFFNGFRWSNDLKELKYLIKRDEEVMGQHVVETPEFIDAFYEGDLQDLTEQYGVHIEVK
jgi:arginyl-tRNA--protein-N-Asp/Glu arginylyltransferase